MESVPENIVDWPGLVFAGVTWGWLFWAFITGKIVSKSTLDTQIEATKRAQEANDKNSEATKTLLERDDTIIEMLESVGAGEIKKVRGKRQ